MLTEAGAFEIKPKGSLHLDYAFTDEDREPLEDEFLARRERQGVVGEFNPDWAFELVYDFAEEGDKDAYLRYQGWDEVEGGEQDNVTLGLNWYARKYVRIMANYIKVRSERRGDSDDPDIVLLRMQLAF